MLDCIVLAVCWKQMLCEAPRDSRRREATGPRVQRSFRSLGRRQWEKLNLKMITAEIWPWVSSRVHEGNLVRALQRFL